MSKKTSQKSKLSNLQEISVILLDEDPSQPRKFFDPDALKELADSIRTRGIKTPISVRFNVKNGRYTINHGHRRYRASVIAGKETIPAYIDNDYSDEDQIIENLQRENLTTREIADYIGRQIALGKTQIQIGKELSKTNSWVSLHAKVLNLPDPVAELFHSGKCSDINLIHLLDAAYKEDPAITIEWIKNNRDGDITRRRVQMLRDFIKFNKNHPIQSHDLDNSSIKQNNSKLELDNKFANGISGSSITNHAIPDKSKNTNQIEYKSNDPVSILDFIWKYQYSAKKIKSILNTKEIHLIKEFLHATFLLGRSSKDDTSAFGQFIISSGPFIGSAFYKFMAYLFGRDMKQFVLDDIFDSVDNIRMESTKK